jgi:ribosomal protein L19
MGARLKRLVKEMLRTKMHDGKTLGIKVRLTQSEIDKLQNYCGLAIRRNVNNLQAMMRAAWAIFFTTINK